MSIQPGKEDVAWKRGYGLEMRILLEMRLWAGNEAIYGLGMRLWPGNEAMGWE